MIKHIYKKENWAFDVVRKNLSETDNIGKNEYLLVYSINLLKFLPSKDYKRVVLRLDSERSLK